MIFKYAFIFIPMIFSLELEAHGPASKTSKMIGGSVNFGSTFNRNLPSSYTMNLSPSFGYFIANNLPIGLKVNIGVNSIVGSSSISYGISPFIRRYFGMSHNRMFIEGQIGYSGNTIPATSSSFSMSAINGDIGIGLANFLNYFVGIETILGYNISNPSNLAGLQHHFGFRVGIQVYLSNPGKSQ